MFRFIILLSLFTYMSSQTHNAGEEFPVRTKPAAPREIRKPIIYAKFETDRIKLQKLIEDGLNRDAVTHIQTVLKKAASDKNHTEFQYFFDQLSGEIENGLFEEDDMPVFDKYVEELIPTLSVPSIDFALLYFLENRVTYIFEDNYRSLCGKPVLTYEEQRLAIKAKRKEIFTQIYNHKPELLVIPYQEIFLEADSASIIESPSLYEYFVDVTNYFAFTDDQTERYEANLDENKKPLKITKAWFGTHDSNLKGLIPCQDLINCTSKYQRILLHLIEMELYHFRQKRYESAGKYAVLRIQTILRVEEQYEFNEKYEFGENLVSYEQKMDAKYQAYIAHQKLYSKTKASNLFSYNIALALYNKSKEYEEGVNTAVIANATEALTNLNEALTKFPNGYRNESLIELRDQIVAPSVSFQIMNNVGIKNPMLLKINYLNTKKAFVKIIRFSTNQRVIHDPNCKFEVIGERILELENDENHLFHSKEFVIDGIDKTGDYNVFIMNDDQNWQENIRKSYSEERNKAFDFAVSELRVHRIGVHTSNKQGKTDVFVSDLLTGKPVKGAVIGIYPENYNYSSDFYSGDIDNQTVPSASTKTDKNGWATIETPDRSRIKISYKGDFQYVSSYYYRNGVTVVDDQNAHHLTTDRNLYRPGQTVSFKVIEFSGKDNNFKVVPNQEIKITVTSYNNEEVAKINGRTNEFGSFSSEFILPASAIGGFQIGVNDVNVGYINVEEYKRPSFEVTLDPITDGAGFGQDVKITGKVMALSGVPLQNANVTVNISRQQYYWYRYSEPIDNEIENFDTLVKTDINGKFSLSFRAKDNSKGQGKGYSINAVATSQTGETHQTDGFVHIGKSIFKASIETNAKLIGTTNIKATASISNQQDAQQENATGIFKLYSLKQTFNFKDYRPWPKPQYIDVLEKELIELFPNIDFVGKVEDQKTLIATVPAKHGVEIDFSQYTDDGGAFSLELESNTSDYTFEKTTSIVNCMTKKSRLPEGLWLYASKNKAEPGDKVDVFFGSGYKKMYSILEIYSGDKLISRDFIKLKKTKKQTILITEEMRGIISLRLFGSLRNKSFVSNANINVPFTNKKLNMEFSTIRKTISPGQVEEISIKVADSKNLAARETELLASMYDASLDQINGGFDWNLFPYKSKYNYTNWSFLPYHQPVAYGGQENDFYAQDLFYLNTNGSYYGNSSGRGNGSGRYLKSEQPSLEMAEMDANSDKEIATIQISAANAPTQMGDAKGGNGSDDLKKDKIATPKPPRIRSNFNETAFFKPNLHTDANGVVSFTYTVPDALTRWKMQVLAHDKTMRVGKVSQILETRKEVMAQAYTPRFFREGDTIVVRATVNNLLPEEIIPNVSLAMFDPYTDKDISTEFSILNSTTRPIASNGSGEFQWKLIVPFGYSVVKYRLIAKNGIHSDGEEKVIPILSNREFVQETQSFTIASKGTTISVLEKLAKNKSTTLKTDRLSLEFTGSPLWNIILSMPYLMEFPHECAEQTFARIYANGIGSRIVEANPSIQNLFKTWKESKPEVFTSELEKNIELKNILLNETPWVRDAISDSEKYKRIAMLFDKERMEVEFNESINKLNLMLTDDGGLPWFIGGRSNPYIALHVASGIQEANFDNEILNQINTRLIAHLDTYFEAEYQENLKQKMISPGLSPTHILWLLTRIGNSEGVKAIETASSKYYSKLLETEWVKQSINTQAMSGTYFELSQKRDLSKKVLASMQNRASKKNLTMYWAENKNGRLWYQSSIETQARTITFFTLMEAPKTEIKALKAFLLQNKRSNAWETTKETTMACQVLLTDGTTIANSDYPQIYVGSENIQAPELLQKNGGYFKKSWAGEDVTPAMATVRVESNSDQFQYGALHWSYYEDLSKITRASNGISIERTYYTKTEKNELRKVDITNLKVGQKLTVELTLKVDQEMDYVHLKDQRASGVEPVNQISGYIYQDGISGYQSIKDASVNFFFDHLSKGTHRVNYEVFVTNEGQLSMGLATLNCMYAPEFKGHSDGVRVVVKP